MRNWTCWICDGTQVCLDHKRRWYLNLAYNWKYKLAVIKKWVSWEINQHWIWLSNWVVESVVARQWPGKGDMTSRTRMDGFSSDLKETLDCPLEIHKASMKESPTQVHGSSGLYRVGATRTLGEYPSAMLHCLFPLSGAQCLHGSISAISKCKPPSHHSQTRQHSTMEPFL